MTTSKKLWAGFGTLTALLVLVSTAIVVQLRTVEGNLRTQADVARPRATATRELEINLLRYALALRTYLQSGDAGQRDLAREQVASVEKHLAEYLRLAATDQQRELGARFAAGWREYRDLGLALLDLSNRRMTRAEVERLRDLRPALETLLDQEMQPDALADVDANKQRTFAGVHGVVDFALVLLAAGVVVAVLTSWAVGRGVLRDERRALADAERLRLAVDATGMGVWQVDYRDGRILWSERCREIFGLPKDAELTRAMLLDRVHPDDRDLLVRATEESLSGKDGGGFAIEHRVVTPAGVRWVAAHGRTQFGGAPGGAPELHTGVLVDVTERRRAEDALRESEARFRRLADAMPQIVYVTNADGRVEFINRQWVEFTGQEHADAADLGAAVHPDDLPAMRMRWAMAMREGDPFSAEFRLRRAADGEYRWFLTRAVPIRDAGGCVTHWYGTSTDIHDQKRIEEALRAGEERLRLALAGARAGAWESDRLAGAVAWSPELYDLFGVDRAAEPSLDLLQSIVHPDDRRRFVAELDAALARAGAFEMEFRVVRPADGAVVWIAHVGRVRRDAAGRVVAVHGIDQDVTARRRAEEALRTSEERYRAFIANSTEGIWRLEFEPPIDTSLPVEEQVELVYRNGRYAECNDVMARMYGLRCPEEFVGKSVDFMLPAADPAARAYVASVVRAGYRVADVDSEERNAHGNAVHFSNSMVGVVEGGLLKRAWGTQRDVTERKRRERHAAFLAEVAGEFARLSTAGDIMEFVGAKLGAYLGLSNVTFSEVDDALGETRVPHGWFREDVPRLTGVYRHVDFVNDEFHRAARGGETVVVRDTAADPRTNPENYRRVKVGAFVLVPFHRAGAWTFSLGACDSGPRDWRPDEVELIQDLANRVFPRLERARAEAALRESEERFRTLADNISQLAWMADGQGSIFWYNKRWYDYTGTTPESQQGWGWQSVHDPAVLPEVVERRTAALAVGEPFDMVFPLRGADGVFRPFLTRAMPVRDDQGRVVRWLGTNTDVSEQRALEEALKDADRRKDEFLATLAHELRNPLAPIRNGLQILKLAGTDPQAADQARAMMERQLGQMVRLIDDLLDVSRISRGKIVLRRRRVDLVAVVQTAVETSRPLIDAAGHRLSLALPKAPLLVDADATRLAQVFANLLNNAAKFTDRGGAVALTVERQGSDAVVAVKDTGEGIPAAMLARIFDLFTQVDRTLERPHSGLGIGLTLVKSLVEMHGGSVEAKSDGPGRGSEFVVRLPVVLEEGAAPVTPSDDADPGHPAAPRRILIADDNEDAAASLAEILDLMGHQVRTAPDGEAALAEAEAFRPDVALLDIGMPRLNGYDACRRLREQPWGRDVVVVALTGWGQEEDRRRSKEAGFDHHLVKPVAARTLTRLLAELPQA